MFSVLKPWCLALIIGVVSHFVTFMVFGVTPLELWTIGWLFDLLGEKNINGGLFYIAIYSHGILLKMLLAIPFAYLLSRIKPDRKWWYVALAVIPLNLSAYSSVFLDGDVIDFFFLHGPDAIFGLLNRLSSLPLALYVVTVFANRKTQSAQGR